MSFYGPPLDYTSLEARLTEEQAAAERKQRARRQSEEAGVSVGYLLSEEFTSLGRKATGNQDPTFYDMKDAFFFGPDPIGKDAVCPRDGERGCALIDTLPAKHRQHCTHFLSWTWGYKVSMLQDALSVWIDTDDLLEACKVFLFMCFFVNNQFRILVSGKSVSPRELEHTFERNLSRIGHVVALLDTWDNPRYLTRIWTIFEQLVAIKLDVPVTMVLAKAAGDELIEKFEKGKQGIQEVKAALTKVHSEFADASVPEDAEAVKALIREQFGFSHVDTQIVKFMLHWMAATFESHMKSIMTQSPADVPESVCQYAEKRSQTVTLNGCTESVSSSLFAAASSDLLDSSWEWSARNKDKVMHL
eukprot:TRINITY_DN28915_c0_g1_i3.p1 TRINITY_DN28915_c0_g1~~TRINITY_DN28915_c0_g1_i3.p1  ORF type:complete len:360 (-),score=65.47 TRINITY_DN28915_c0_g1_i3:66-1145(-)